MPKLGKDNYFIRLISKKTKIKAEDVFDVIMAVSECMAEAFFEANPGEKQRVNFGAVLLYWKNTNLGPGIFCEPSDSFLRDLAKTKYEQKTLLATLLYQKMLPINRERLAERFKSSDQKIAKKKPQNPHRQRDYATKAKENRLILREKRKLQKKMLSDSISPIAK